MEDALRLWISSSRQISSSAVAAAEARSVLAEACSSFLLASLVDWSYDASDSAFRFEAEKFSVAVLWAVRFVWAVSAFASEKT